MSRLYLYDFQIRDDHQKYTDEQFISMITYDYMKEVVLTFRDTEISYEFAKSMAKVFKYNKKTKQYDFIREGTEEEINYYLTYFANVTMNYINKIHYLCNNEVNKKKQILEDLKNKPTKDALDACGKQGMVLMSMGNPKSKASDMASSKMNEQKAKQTAAFSSLDDMKGSATSYKAKSSGAVAGVESAFGSAKGQITSQGNKIVNVADKKDIYDQTTDDLSEMMKGVDSKKLAGDLATELRKNLISNVISEQKEMVKDQLKQLTSLGSSFKRGGIPSANGKAAIMQGLCNASATDPFKAAMGGSLNAALLNNMNIKNPAMLSKVSGLMLKSMPSGSALLAKADSSNTKSLFNTSTAGGNLTRLGTGLSDVNYLGDAGSASNSFSNNVASDSKPKRMTLEQIWGVGIEKWSNNEHLSFMKFIENLKPVKYSTIDYKVYDESDTTVNG